MRELSILLICLSTLCACGGGGGSDTVIPNYLGAWRGWVDLVSNTCPRAIPEEFQHISFLHNVNQGLSEDALGNLLLDIVLEDGVESYTGIGEIGTDGDGDSFSVTGSVHLLPGFLDSFDCREVIDFEYEAIDLTEEEFRSGSAGFVTRHSSITCIREEEIQTCDVTYTGSADRT